MYLAMCPRPHPTSNTRGNLLYKEIIQLIGIIIIIIDLL